MRMCCWITFWKFGTYWIMKHFEGYSCSRFTFSWNMEDQCDNERLSLLLSTPSLILVLVSFHTLEDSARYVCVCDSHLQSRDALMSTVAFLIPVFFFPAWLVGGTPGINWLSDDSICIGSHQFIKCCIGHWASSHLLGPETPTLDRYGIKC